MSLKLFLKVIAQACVDNSPRDKTNPPRTITTSSANDPKVLATTICRPKAEIKRNIPDAIWLMHNMTKNCLKNLQGLCFFVKFHFCVKD